MPKTARTGTIAALVLWIALAIPGAASAQQMWRDGSSDGVSESDLIPALDSSEAYVERYTFRADLDGGGRLGITFGISNMGWGDLQGAAKVMVDLPDREKYKYKKKLGQDQWTSSDDELRLSIADTTLTHPEKGKFLIEHDGDKSVRVVFKNRLPMWQPGNGEIRSGDSYQRKHLMAPRASVDGTIEFGGEKVEFSSEKKGYASHEVTNTAPYKTALRFAWFRAFHDNVTIIWKYTDFTEKFGGGDVAWIYVGYNRRVVFTSANADIKFGRLSPDGESGYKVPRAAQVEAKQGEDSVKFVHKASSYDRKNLMKNWGGVIRTVASSVTNPYRFDMPGRYSFQMTIQGTSAKVSGEDQFTMDILNE